VRHAGQQPGHLPCMLRSRRSPGRVRRAGVVLTCGKDNLLKLVDPRTFQAGRPHGLTGPVLSCAVAWPCCRWGGRAAHARTVQGRPQVKAGDQPSLPAAMLCPA